MQHATPKGKRHNLQPTDKPASQANHDPAEAAESAVAAGWTGVAPDAKATLARQAGLRKAQSGRHAPVMKDSENWAEMEDEVDTGDVVAASTASVDGSTVTPNAPESSRGVVTASEAGAASASSGAGLWNGGISGGPIGYAALGALLVAATGLSVGGRTQGTGGYTPITAVAVSGSVTAGASAAGLLVEVFNAAGKLITSTKTDSSGGYALSVSTSYAGQALVIKVTDTNTADGMGYKDEATGASQDFGSALRTTFVLDGSKATQTAQITPLTELATRKIVNADGKVTLPAADIAKMNKAIGALFGVDDMVGGIAPDVLDTGSNTSNAYGNALALLSGMDAVNARLGADNAMEATLARLTGAITLTGVQAKFSSTDIDTLSLMSQAVSEMSVRYGATAGVMDALNGVATQAAATAKGEAQTSVFITAGANLLGTGKTTSLTFGFDSAPTAPSFQNMLAQLQVEGGSLGALTWAEGQKTYTANFTQSGSTEPRVWVADSGGSAIFSNAVAMALDAQAPILSLTSISGYERGSATLKSVVKEGDTLRITLSASETLLMNGTPGLTLQIGGKQVIAAYDSSLSSTRSLVFSYTVLEGLADTDGLSVASLNLGNGTTITDIAGNPAPAPDLSYSGIAPQVDTAAPEMVAVSLSAKDITLNFDDIISKGYGSVTVSKDGSVFETLSVSKGTLAADGKSLTFKLGRTPDAGSYTITADSTAFTNPAGKSGSGQTDSTAPGGFTVGAVALSIDPVSEDNLLSEGNVGGGFSVTGTLSGASDILAGLSAGDLQVWLQPTSGGAAVQATVNTLNLDDGTWSATVSPGGSLLGRYLVQASIHTDTVQSGTSTMVVVDNAVQVTVGQVAIDNHISLAEQSLIKGGKALAIPLMVEKGARVTVTFSGLNDQGEELSLYKDEIFGTGTIDTTSLQLTQSELTELSTGLVSMTITGYDAAGNRLNEGDFVREFNIDAAAAKISKLALSSNTTGRLGVGSKIVATVTFDQAITLSGATAGMELAIEVGGEKRYASYVKQSTDKKTLTFSYSVQAGDTDTDGVSVSANAIQLHGVTVTDENGVSALTTHSAVAANSSLQVVTSSDAVNLTVSVAEAGYNTSGTPTVSGKLVASGTVSKVSFEGAETSLNPGSSANSYGAPTIVGKYGSWKVGADGSFSYSLSNADADTQALKLVNPVTDALSFTDAQGETKQLTVNVTGANDAPMVSAPLTASAREDDATINLNLLYKAVDVEAGTLYVKDQTNKVNGVEITVKVGEDELPVLTWNSTFQKLEITAGAFDHLAQDETTTVVISYNVADGSGTKAAKTAQTATITITGSNDAPTRSQEASARKADVTEGEPSTALDLFSGVSDVDNGDTLSVSNLRYQINGLDVGGIPNGLHLIGGSVLSLDPKSSAFSSLAPGERQTILASYNVTDGHGGSLAQTATFIVTGIANTTAPLNMQALLGMQPFMVMGDSADAVQLTAGTSMFDVWADSTPSTVQLPAQQAVAVQVI